MEILDQVRRRIPTRLALPLTFTIAFFLASQVLRLVLACFFHPASPVAAADWFRAFLVGVHFDLAVSLVLFSPLALCMGLPSQRCWNRPTFRAGLIVVSLVVWCVLIFLLLAEGFFFEEFQSRFNTVAIDYLIYPHEVFANVWESYPMPMVIGAVLLLAGAIVWMGWRVSRQVERLAPAVPTRAAACLWLAIAIVSALTIRLDEARFSRERTVNEIASSTFVSALTAALTRNLDYAHFYPTMSREDAYRRTRKLLSTPDANFVEATDSLQRHVAGDTNAPRLNLVLLLEESLGSEFWGSLGRKEPTRMPRMDAVATNEALLFDNLYADGNRTIRGYEGVFCSFPPLPGDSIVARDRSEHVETIARVLARDGYDTTFLYAGRGLFDGTGPFVKANGWSNFVELKDFKNPAFTTVWGVCNEDLYDRVLVECRDRYARGLPFFVTSMSVSNHKPYTYPPGRIPEDPLKRRRAHVVKYTDYALGRFVDMARKEPFWTNTIFVVVADHGARVYGSQTIPIRSYEIPMVVLGPAAVSAPRRVSTLGCQLDIAPTLLGLIGRPYDSYCFGRDLLKWPDLPGRCLLHHNRSFGIYSDEHLVVFSLNKKVEYFSGNPKREQMRRVPEPEQLHRELEADAVAMFQVADDVYMNRKFMIAPRPSRTSAGVPR